MSENLQGMRDWETWEGALMEAVVRPSIPRPRVGCVNTVVSSESGSESTVTWSVFFDFFCLSRNGNRPAAKMQLKIHSNLSSRW